MTGVWTGIAAILMTFAALVSALVVRQGDGGDWRHFQLPPILIANTLVLMASSVVLWVGAHEPEARPARARAALALALVLGLGFVAGQLIAWRDLAAQGVYLATGPSGAFFFVFTALHAIHLLGGIAGLVYARRRLVAGIPGRTVDAAVTYWHFMGALWIGLLLTLAVSL
jgi:cytochrome c oxidase subunit 3